MSSKQAAAQYGAALALTQGADRELAKLIADRDAIAAELLQARMAREGAKTEAERLLSDSRDVKAAIAGAKAAAEKRREAELMTEQLEAMHELAIERVGAQVIRVRDAERAQAKAQAVYFRTAYNEAVTELWTRNRDAFLRIMRLARSSAIYNDAAESVAGGTMAAMVEHYRGLAPASLDQLIAYSIAPQLVERAHADKAFADMEIEEKGAPPSRFEAPAHLAPFHAKLTGLHPLPSAEDVAALGEPQAPRDPLEGRCRDEGRLVHSIDDTKRRLVLLREELAEHQKALERFKTTRNYNAVIEAAQEVKRVEGLIESLESSVESMNENLELVRTVRDSEAELA